MKRCMTVFSLIAFLLALAGVIIAIAAYFRNKEMVGCCCDDDEFMEYDNDDLDYFSAEMEDMTFDESGSEEFLAEDETPEN